MARQGAAQPLARPCVSWPVHLHWASELGQTTPRSPAQCAVDDATMATVGSYSYLLDQLPESGHSLATLGVHLQPLDLFGC
jgi:hypothetical protein